MDQILPPKLNDLEFEALRQIAAHPATFHIPSTIQSRLKDIGYAKEVLGRQRSVATRSVSKFVIGFRQAERRVEVAHHQRGDTTARNFNQRSVLWVFDQIFGDVGKTLVRCLKNREQS